eukprot:3429019-Ditylum_brightwellii.AAC.1
MQLPEHTAPIADLKDNTNRWQCSIPATLNTTIHQETQQYNTFQEYCKSLPKWCRHLLVNINFIWDEEEICLILQNNKTVYVVTDRGKTTGIGYYGWVIATVCDILIKPKEHAPGPKKLMESLRTESTSILS